jgi:hypothetical protein
VSAEPPTLRVLRGCPDDAEVAAVVVALLCAQPAGAGPAPVTSAWTRRRHNLRTPLVPGPGAWRAATAPR